MFSTTSTILFDNCAISACVEVGGWKALVSRYRLETVEEVAAEAGTPSHGKTLLDPNEFTKSVTIHPVTRSSRIEAKIKYEDLASLDSGEQDLWVHALQRTDAWMLCGPDTASVKFGVLRGYGDRLVSLEEMFEHIGFRPKTKLPYHFTRKWLQETKGKFEVERAMTGLM